MMKKITVTNNDTGFSISELDVKEVSTRLTSAEYKSIIRSVSPVVLKDKNTEYNAIYLSGEPFAKDFGYSDVDERVGHRDFETIVSGKYLKDGEIRDGQFFLTPKVVSVLISGMVNDGGKQIYLHSVEVANAMGKKLIPSYYQDAFVCEGITKPEDYKNNTNRANLSSYRQNLRSTHSADNDNPLYVRIVNEYAKLKEESKKEIPKEAFYLEKLFGGKSIGLEYEVSQGNINSSYLPHLGIIPVIDGSIGRDYFHEYPTVILRDAYDIDKIKEQCKMLKRFCNVSVNCAFHIHIGNVSKKMEHVLALYHLAYRLQQEMYSLVHPYKQDEPGSLGKAKNYSAPLLDIGVEDLKGIDIANPRNKEYLVDKYEELYTLFSTRDKMGEDIPWSKDRKWECPTRYTWFNMVPFFFSGAGTIENRLMTPTLDYQRVMLWTVLNIGLIRYAEKNYVKIIESKEKILLADIVDEIRHCFGEDTTEEERKFYDYLANTLMAFIIKLKTQYRRVHRNVDKTTVGNTTNKSKTIGTLAKQEINESNNHDFVVVNHGYLSV
jgi:hypothetical protein